MSVSSREYPDDRDMFSAPLSRMSGSPIGDRQREKGKRRRARRRDKVGDRAPIRTANEVRCSS